MSGPPWRLGSSTVLVRTRTQSTECRPTAMSSAANSQADDDRAAMPRATIGSATA